MSNIFDGLFKHNNGAIDMNGEMDIPSDYDTSELMSSEFFDSVLSLEQDNGFNFMKDFTSSEGLLGNLDDDVFLSSESSSHTDEVRSMHSMSSDSEKYAPMESEMATVDEVKSIEHDLFMSLLSASQLNQNKVPEKKQTKLIVHNPNNTKKVILTKQYPNNKKVNYKNKQQQVLRVQSISASGKPLLVPFNLAKIKSFKIVNTNSLKEQTIQVSPATSNFQEILSVSSPENTIEEDDVEVSSEDSSQYPALNLTPEEKRLLAKDGIQLPTHYPLTKNEERELKRIRRKIRNKISAQDSRKRKKEYVDGLEARVKRGTEENKNLMKRVRQLQKQNGRLMEQMSKLQALLFSSGSSKATPTTCLMIVLFSALLVSLPNLGINNNKDSGDQQQVAARRALLSSQQPTYDEDSLNMEEFLSFGKDDESELDNIRSAEIADNENKTDREFFNKLLNDIKKEYDISSDKINCTNVSSEFDKIMQLCKMHENEFQGVIKNMKNFLEKEATVLDGKDAAHSKIDYGGKRTKNGFLEPDIDDELDGDGEPANKRIKVNVDTLHLEESIVPITATVGSNSFGISSSKKE